ncbi:hypothetical protein AB1Y20_009313 [Prymnesium parvum]|uniref:AAA+ ATPase domain-containing protein n=1 Tax=Prymnesium parvum TaxID=97485 RepID=A0AB34K474_PRYPA
MIPSDDAALDDVLRRGRAALCDGGRGGGTLLHGPPGCGKTTLLHHAAAHLRLPAVWLRPPLDAPAVAAAVAAAAAAAPCVLAIDELHALAPRRAVRGSREHRTLLQLADGVQQLRERRVFVVAACRALQEVHPALRRSGRLDHAVGMGAPSRAARLAILRDATARWRGAAAEGAAVEAQLRGVAEAAHGLCAAQLRGVCLHAALSAWRAAGGAPRLSAAPSAEDWRAAVEAAAAVSLGALRLASSATRPVALRLAASAAAPADRLSLDTLPAGRELFGSVVLPLRAPEAFRRLGVAPPRGVLLHGPHGAGKTTLARAVAAEVRANFVEVQAAQLLSSVVGEAEARLAALFTAARNAAPCVLFIDQIDTLAPPRGNDLTSEGTMDRLLSLLLVELDGVQTAVGPPVVLLAACHSPGQLDPAILRPGRLDVHIAIAAPDSVQRLKLLERMLSGSPVDDSQVDLQALAARTEGFSLAQLSALCREAGMCALREDLYGASIGSRHIDAAMATVQLRM